MRKTPTDSEAGRPAGYHQATGETASYRLIAETIPHLVWTTTPDGFHDYFNSRWEEYIGHSADETKGYVWHTFLHPDDEQRAQDVWNHCLATGAPYEIEYRFRRYDGVYRWFLARAMPIRDEHGEIVKWFGTCTDIDDQKQAQEERTLLLVRERQARRAAEAASQARDDFIAMVSHELRTPLATILGWALLLENESSDEQRVRDVAAVLTRSAKTLSKLVDDLLDVSRIMAGKLEITPRPVGLETLVESVVASFRSAAEEKGLALQTGPVQALECEVDEARLHQVLSNLIGNAVKFTARGEITVSLERDGDDAVLRVRDTGEGLAEAFLPLVFERFKQGDESASRVHGGLGLGLAIVKSLVELHGGSITAQSDGVGHGATFEVRLPLIRSPDHDEPSIRDPMQALSAKRESDLDIDSLANLTVLVVDDEVDVRNMVIAALESFGATVVSATSARDARETLGRRQVDAIVCDIAMPGETGYEFVSDLRARGNKLPILALTAYAQRTDIQRAEQAGFDMHVAKPVEPRTLAQSIQALTGR